MGNVMNNSCKNKGLIKYPGMEDLILLAICLSNKGLSSQMRKIRLIKSICQDFHIKLFLINISLILCLSFLFVIPDVSAFRESGIISYDTAEKTAVSRSIKECHRKIDLINNQLSLLQENRAWLNSKIEDIKDFNRHVPESMEESMVTKTSRIKALEKIKKRLTTDLQKLVKKFGTINRVALSPSAVNRKSWSAQEKSNEDKKLSDKKTYVSIQRTGQSAKKNNFIKGLQRRIKKLGIENWVEIASDDECCRVVTTLPILFASGSSKIAGTYKIFFKKLADLIRDYDVRVDVDGYADIDSIHNKKYPSNFELGAARASNVVHELVKHGIKPSVFKISTTGKYRFNARGMSKKKVVERRADLTIIFAV